LLHHLEKLHRNMTFIDIAQQCCDADDYLDMGYVCAKAGLCYNALRPAGDTLWFGIPYFFNTSENIFFYLHVFLLLIVAWTAFCVFTTPSTPGRTDALLPRKLTAAGLFMAAVMILIWPAFFHPLSDTPASLLFLEGCLLALGARYTHNPLGYFSAGICLGCCTLLRAAYFLPLCIAATVFFVSWLWQTMQNPGKNSAAPIFIFSFMLPLSFQFYTTWKYTGHWSFLSDAHSRQMLHLHLESPAVGYDTALPQTGIFWSPDCVAHAGLLPSLEKMDLSSFRCILENRLMFYLGSYSPDTYSGEHIRNFLDNPSAEKIGSSAGWLLHGVHAELSSALSPMQDLTASRLAPEGSAAGDVHFIEARSLFPLPPGDYRFSVWLWSAHEQSPTSAIMEMNSLGIAPATAQNPVAFVTNSRQRHEVTIRDRPQQYTIDFKQTASSYLSSRITLADAICAWGAALEPVATATGYHRTPEKLQAVIGGANNTLQTGRYFSPGLLLINMLVISAAIFYLVRLFLINSQPVVIFVSAIIITSFAQCLLIIPEQRYFQGVLSACWLMACLWLSSAHEQRK
jgi:hypothetical protein